MRHCREPPLQLLVDENVQAGVGGVAGGRRSKPGEKPAEALGPDDVSAGADETAVGVVVGLVADFQHRHGHHDESCGDARDGARGEIGRVGEFREGGGGFIDGLAGEREGRVGLGDGLAQGIQAGEVEGRAEARSEGGGECATP